MLRQRRRMRSRVLQGNGHVLIAITSMLFP